MLSYRDMRLFPLWLILEWPMSTIDTALWPATERYIVLRGGARRPLWYQHPAMPGLVVAIGDFEEDDIVQD